MPYTTAQLQDAVNAIFHAYDKDGSENLDTEEITSFLNAFRSNAGNYSAEVGSVLNDSLKHINPNQEPTVEDVNNFIKSIDENSDGKVSKTQLEAFFKKATNS